jgi:hypothetical protein
MAAPRSMRSPVHPATAAVAWSGMPPTSELKRGQGCILGCALLVEAAPQGACAAAERDPWATFPCHNEYTLRFSRWVCVCANAHDCVRDRACPPPPPPTHTHTVRAYLCALPRAARCSLVFPAPTLRGPSFPMHCVRPPTPAHVTRVVPLPTPIPHGGQLGLWTVQPDAASALHRAIAGAEAAEPARAGASAPATGGEAGHRPPSCPPVDRPLPPPAATGKGATERVPAPATEAGRAAPHAPPPRARGSSGGSSSRTQKRGASGDDGAKTKGEETKRKGAKKARK